MKIEKMEFNKTYKKGMSCDKIKSILIDKIERMLVDIEDFNNNLGYKTKIVLVMEEVK